MEIILFREATFDTGKVVLNYAEGPNSRPPLVMLVNANFQAADGNFKCRRNERKIRLTCPATRHKETTSYGRATLYGRNYRTD